MARHWTFGQKIHIGFAITLALAVVVGAIAVYSLRAVVASKDEIITFHAQTVIHLEQIRGAFEAKVVGVRGYLITGEDRFLLKLQDAREDLLGHLAELRRIRAQDEGIRMVESLDRREREHQEGVERTVAARKAGITGEALNRVFEEQIMPRYTALLQELETSIAAEQRALEEARRRSTAMASSAIRLLVSIVIAAALLTGAIALFLARSLGTQIRTAVGQVQSSATRLHTAANQQATGAKQEATAMTEISTTTHELIVTSRQITESAQRVSQIAEQTTAAAKAGGNTVERAHESFAGIRRHVDLVVNHMLDLGRKSQQIGAVLDLVSELSEQTNILAINATIEAAGAGEVGKRFAVVADEIRKLADRVGEGAKEIRALIEDVRGAVNTTVMATESGSKAVDAGSRQFADVAVAFKQIASLISTTTDAAREIELSTKQQSTAVEQVNVAISNVAAATKESEASSHQTLSTATQLTSLSRDLLLLVGSDR